MNKSKVLFLLIVSLLFLQSRAQRDIPEGYRVILSDDFNETVLDPDIWTKGLWGAQDAHLFPNKNKGGGRNRINDNFAGYVVDSNAVIANGYLELHNVKETIAGSDPDLTLNFTNAMINTLGKVKFNGSRNPIRIKMRAKFPVGSDVWPSLWLVAQYDWPPEIDVWEYFGQWFVWGSRDLMKLSWIYGSNFNKGGEVSWKYLDFDDAFSIDEFHVYDFEWNDQYMISKIDGTEFSRLTRGGSGEYGIPDDLWPDTISEYSIVVQNGRMMAVVDQKGLANSKSNVFIIDYIDVYEKVETPADIDDMNSGQKLKYMLSPNPSKDGVFHINTHDLKVQKTIDVYNMLGQRELVIDGGLLQNNTVNLSVLGKGMYLVKLYYDNHTCVQKVFVQ